MAFMILHTVTINISRALESLFDELEYRSARRAVRRPANAKAKRRSQSKVLSAEVITASSGISFRAT